MEVFIGMAIAFAFVIVVWKGRPLIDVYLKDVQEDLLADRAVKAPERAKEVQEAYGKLQEMVTGDAELVSAEDVLAMARGEKPIK